MSDNFLRNAWSSLFVLLVAVSLNGISLTQGWGIALEWPLDVDADDRTTYQWAPIMLAAWLAVASAFLVFTREVLRRRAAHAAWDRLPGFFGLPANLRDPFALRLRKTTVGAGVVVTLYAGWHFFRKMLKADVFCDDTIVVDAWYEHFSSFVSPLVAFGPGPRCRLDAADTGVTFFPFWEPWVMAILLVCLTWIWISALRVNARRP